MIDTTILANGTMPRPLSPIRCERIRSQPPKGKRAGARLEPPKPRLAGKTAHVGIAEPVRPTISITEAHSRDYWRAWRRIRGIRP